VSFGDEEFGIAIGAGFFGSAIAGLSVAEFAVPLLLPSTRAAGSVLCVELEAAEALSVEQVDAMSDALCRLISLPETVPFTETV